MEELPNRAGEKRIEFPKEKLDPANTEQLLTDLTTLLKFKNSSELIATFKAGTIPIILDVLARDPGKEGQQIVSALLQQIESLKTYYDSRKPKEEVKGTS